MAERILDGAQVDARAVQDRGEAVPQVMHAQAGQAERVGVCPEGERDVARAERRAAAVGTAQEGVLPVEALADELTDPHERGGRELDGPGRAGLRLLDAPRPARQPFQRAADAYRPRLAVHVLHTQRQHLVASFAGRGRQKDERVEERRICGDRVDQRTQPGTIERRPLRPAGARRPHSRRGVGRVPAPRSPAQAGMQHAPAQALRLVATGSGRQRGLNLVRAQPRHALAPQRRRAQGRAYLPVAGERRRSGLPGRVQVLQPAVHHLADGMVVPGCLAGRDEQQVFERELRRRLRPFGLGDALGAAPAADGHDGLVADAGGRLLDFDV